VELIETIRPYEQPELGRRVRVLFEGATYRGRAREVIWNGTARFRGNRILEARPINFFNPDKPLIRDGDEGLRWQALTTGNFVGFDVWLERDDGRLEIETPLIRGSLSLDEISLEDRVLDASGVLPRLIRVYRLPERLDIMTLRFRRRITLRDVGDNALFIRLTQEDGTRAWTSPVYVFR
jgi:hypothetical protein